MVSLDEICRGDHLPRFNSNYTVGLAKVTASLLTNLRSLESFENLLLLAVEVFGDLPNLPFSVESVKRIHIPRKEGYRKRNWFKRIHPWKLKRLHTSHFGIEEMKVRAMISNKQNVENEAFKVGFTLLKIKLIEKFKLKIKLTETKI